MELQTAIEILEYHQQWRLGKREDMIHEPKKLTEALDIVLSEVKKFSLGADSVSLLADFANYVLHNANWSESYADNPWYSENLDKCVSSEELAELFLNSR
jgi:hypothetical protein